MNLIFNDYIKFLNDKGIDTKKYNFQEGYYWLDRQIIKCYDKQGQIHKILRLYIDNNLDITIKEYKNKPFEIESWQETIDRKQRKLKQLENESLELIKKSIYKYDGYNVAVLSSGGKDSSVVTHLVKEVINSPLIIFNNTSLDCADTYRFIKKEDNLLITNPEEGFYQWRKRQNFIPTRFSRSCCTIFKENNMINSLNKENKYLFFMGMRNKESNARANYTDEWKNNKWKDRQWQGILPIRKWTEEEIWLYILYRNIPMNPKYFKGYRRVGCNVACPFYSKSTWVLDKYWYPNIYNRWHEILEEDFIKNKKACIMNCTLEEYHLNWNGGIVHKEPSNEVIKEFAEQQNLDIHIAKKYFNKTCINCKKKLKKDDIGLSMKYYGRNIENFKCINCLSKDLGVDKKELKEKIKEFRNDGCSLF